MQILVIGFQRSGTTLLRRMIHIHPQVKRIFHEHLLVSKFRNDKKQLLNYISNKRTNNKKDNWGEKVPFYGKIKGGLHPFTYCQKWTELFPESKIIHIVRHPIDVGLSTVNKYPNINDINIPLKKYNKLMTSLIGDIDKLDNALTIKYEDLLLNTDETINKIFKFCGLKEDIEIQTLMSGLKRVKYQKINESRAFNYKKQKNMGIKVKLGKVIEELNMIGGVEY